MAKWYGNWSDPALGGEPSRKKAQNQHSTCTSMPPYNPSPSVPYGEFHGAAPPSGLGRAGKNIKIPSLSPFSFLLFPVPLKIFPVVVLVKWLNGTFGQRHRVW
jgi:hypothetical protein